jgi:hypothetical protein
VANRPVERGRAIEGDLMMSKAGKRAAAAELAGAAGSASGRRLRKLERRLATAREMEAKRIRQADEAVAGGTARGAEMKRRRQVEKARRRAVELEAELVGLRVLAAPKPSAYCLRERRMAEMAAPTPIVMRNGRAGLAGTCSGCGSRLVRPG